jgi:hypothetical protein
MVLQKRRTLDLEDVLKNPSDDKNVSELIRNGLSVDHLDITIRGLREVKKNFVEAISKAEFISKQGYIPMILLIGPTSSGKTVIAETLRGFYYTKLQENASVYTLSINNKVCPYKESPYDIFRSMLPFDIEEVGLSQLDRSIPSDEGVADIKTYSVPEEQKIGIPVTRKGPELCATCRHNLEDAIRERREADKAGQDTKENKTNIGIVEAFPQTATVQLNDEKLPDKFYQIITNANRGFLLIGADKSRLSSINPRTYQFLVGLYDNTLSDQNGNRVPLDMLVIINANEDFFAVGEHKKELEIESATPLKERMIMVKVRRNLSYSEEEKMYRDAKIPISKMFPRGLKYLAMTSILSRIGESVLSSESARENSLLNEFNRNVYGRGSSSDSESRNNDQIETVLTALNLYDSGTLNRSKITKRLSQLIGSGDLYEQIESLIFEDGEYNSGWDEGISSRFVMNQLTTRKTGEFNFSDLYAFMEENGDSGLSSKKAEFIRNALRADIRSDIDKSLLSFLFKTIDPDTRKYVSMLERRLDYIEHEKDPNSKKFEDPEDNLGTLSRFIDTDALRGYINQYKEMNAPIETSFSTNFDSLLTFVYKRQKSSLLKNYELITRDLFDKNSEMHKYIKKDLIDNHGYWEESFKEALSIYKSGGLDEYDQ